MKTTPKPATKKTVWAVVKCEIEDTNISFDVYQLTAKLGLQVPGAPAPIDFQQQFVTQRYGVLAISERLSFPIVKTEAFLKAIGVVSKIGALVNSEK